MPVLDIRLEAKSVNSNTWNKVKKIIEEAFSDKGGLYELTLLNED